MGATIFFADEAAVRTDHHGGTTWAPVGRTPVVTATGDRKSVSMISAISARGQLHFELFEGSMNAAKFIEFLKKLVADCPTPVFVIVDGSAAHTAKALQRYVESTEGGMSIFFLPPYSPDLNPDEWLWNNVKNTQNYAPDLPNRSHESKVTSIALPATYSSGFRDSQMSSGDFQRFAPCLHFSMTVMERKRSRNLYSD